MLMDFDKSFKDNSPSGKAVPKVILDHLNGSLHGYDLEYYDGGDGTCKVRSKSGNYTISGIRFILPKAMRNVLGDHPTVEDIQRYAYNSQQSIPVESVKKGSIILNGKEMSIDQLEMNPFEAIEIIADRAFIFPPKMDESVDVTFSGNSTTVCLKMHRVPDNSLNWYIYKSSPDNYPLSFVLRFNSVEKQMSFSVSIKMREAECAKDILDSMNLYNAFITGNGKVGGQRIVTDNKNLTEKFEQPTISFWKKAADLERLLQTSFRIAIDKITATDAYLIEYMYSSLNAKKPSRLSERPNTVSFHKPTKEMLASLETLHEEFGLFFSRQKNIQLFGCDIQLYEIMAIFRCKMDSYTHVGDELTITLTDARQAERRYSVGLLFLSEKEMIDYEKNTHVLNTFSRVKRSIGV